MEQNAYQIGIKTSDFRGDHSADIYVALNIPSTMTIAELIDFVFEKREVFNVNKVTDHIEIRFCGNKLNNIDGSSITDQLHVDLGSPKGGKIVTVDDNDDVEEFISADYVIRFNKLDSNGDIIKKEAVDLNYFQQMKISGEILDYVIDDDGVKIIKRFNIKTIDPTGTTKKMKNINIKFIQNEKLRNY